MRVRDEVWGYWDWNDLSGCAWSTSTSHCAYLQENAQRCESFCLLEENHLRPFSQQEFGETALIKQPLCAFLQKAQTQIWGSLRAQKVLHFQNISRAAGWVEASRLEHISVLRHAAGLKLLLLKETCLYVAEEAWKEGIISCFFVFVLRFEAGREYLNADVWLYPCAPREAGLQNLH